MKVTCEYCDSYVEITEETSKCPACGAPLGDSIKAEQEKLKKEAELAQEKVDQEQEEQRKHETKQNIISAVAGIAGSLVAGSAMRKTSHPHRPDRDGVRDPMGPDNPGPRNRGYIGRGPRGNTRHRH